jgi:DNA modification methylase
MVEIKDNNKTFVLSHYEKVFPLKDVQTFIIDPPYNIGFDYKSEYKDKLNKQQYADTMYDIIQLMYESSKDNASCFLINYPEIIAEFYHIILDTNWNVHQWINWVYPSNIGMSNKKFTRASRTILWLTKDNPKIYIDAMQQPYKNPNDKRIKELISKGKKGTNFYDWWEINLCKNVSKDKNNYVNQIPEELLKRLILTTTDEGDLVADPMCGSGSTIVTAAKLNRLGWGCDLNENLLPIWKEHCDTGR